MDSQIQESTKLAVFVFIGLLTLGYVMWYLGTMAGMNSIFSVPEPGQDQWQRGYRRDNLDLCKSNHVNPGIRTQRSMNGGDEGIQVCDSQR